MQQLKSNAAGRILRTLGMFTVVATGWAFGQTTAILRVEIPFPFTAGTKALAPGMYMLSTWAGNGWLDLRSNSGEAVRVPIITGLGGPSEFRNGTLVFDKANGGRTLSEVWMPGAQGVLLHRTPAGHTHEMLIGAAANTESLSGKAAYERTCRRCHGSEGKGDENADKFFNTKIPRLGSAYVQDKPDAEIREVITKGRRAMDPVQIEETGFRHPLSPQSADAVIAYVRTLRR
jgi:mono/diheme cytochrome c family protein